MRVSGNYALAASIAALCVAAPAAFYVLRQPARTNDVPATATPKVADLQSVLGRDHKDRALAEQREQDLRRRNAEARQEAAIAAVAAKTAQPSTPVVEAQVAPSISPNAQAPAEATANARGVAASGFLVPRSGPTGNQGQAAALPEASAAKAHEAPRQESARIAAAPPLSPAALPPPGGRAQLSQLQAEPKFRADQASRLGGQVAVLAPPPPFEPIAQQHVDHGRDRFESKETNPIKSVAAEPVSTFSVDVDTASYSIVRRSLNAGRLPPKDAVRVEEMINYFPYDYARPESADAPFRASVEVFASPWNAKNQLVHIGLKGYDLKNAERPRANLVLLVDISGSMAPSDRLPLLKNAFRMLLDNLRPEDTVAIVTYASGSDIRLAPTRVADKSRILRAIDSLNAGGSTHGAAGITDAYKVAEANFDQRAVNRVILATDGDWNVGITNRDELKGFVERKRQTGIYLSVLGVGMGNHNDALMQALAQNGNGAAAYIDTLSEARKVLVDEASSTLFPIAKDVKIQLEFNPARVSEYRLIGYESRMLRREDFNNDKVDAGDVGSGHSVTAIYEVTPIDAPQMADVLRYQQQNTSATQRVVTADQKSAEIGFLKLRYKLPKEEASRLSEFVIGPGQVRRTIAEASTEARFSTAVAAFGQLLRGAPYTQGFAWDDVIALANGAKGEDAFGYRAEFVNLVRLARSASPSVGRRAD